MWCKDRPREARGARSLVVVSAVVRSFDVNSANSLDALPLLVLIEMVRSTCGAPCGLQEGIVWASAIVGLVQQDVEGLLINSGFWELYLPEEREQHNQASVFFPRGLQVDLQHHLYTFVCFFSVA